MTKRAFLVLGNQLFDPKPLSELKHTTIFIREDTELCVHFKYHKLKIALFLNAMRSYAEELSEAGCKVVYQELARSPHPYEHHLKQFLVKEKIMAVELYEIEDKFFEERILALFKELKLEVVVHPSPMFLTSREQFKKYLSKSKKPFMRNFYIEQRKRLRVLLDAGDKPLGGQWSFDEMNRKPLPASVQPPALKLKHKHDHAADINKLCEEFFPDHPGDASNPWFATTREGAREWLKKFLEERFENFGPYEDALAPNQDFVFHSVLTPYLNTGLLTPAEVVKAALSAGKRKKINIESIEGFIRQVIGWREFIRGIYQNYSEHQEKFNFFGHKRTLTKAWYDGSTGIEPLDLVIKKADKYGYAHHIERLMVVGNLMLLCEVHPHEAHRWFMEMFIDSSDWVMGPNVYGMAIFSDGGIFATKPYICGSNYYRKMGGYKKGDWCEGVDGLYWQFIDKHRDFFTSNPRLSMMVRLLDKMDSAKKKKLFAAATELREKITGAAKRS